MRDVAIIAFSQAPAVRQAVGDEVEMLLPVIQDVVRQSGLPKEEIGFTVSGSCDYLIGRPFSFVMALDAVGAWPPIRESHVEMDGAWALYEAWVRLQHGDVDSALVYAFGRSSLGDLPRILAQQLDPYVQAPLWADSVSMAALQARACLDAGRFTERDMAEVAVRSRRAAADNPNAQLRTSADVDALLAEPYLTDPLRRHDCPPLSDSAAAIVLAAGDLARELCARPAWIRGLDHRVEVHDIGLRDLTRSPSTAEAARRAGAFDAPLDVAEIYAPFTHQQLLLEAELGLGDGPTRVNPSGGALAAHAYMVAGLVRLGEAAARVMAGDADRALAHATSGPCLQQNLVCVLEAR